MPDGFSAVLWTLGAIAVIIIILTVYFAVRDRKEKPVTGRRALEGEIGVARTDINPQGQVLVHGEWWNARSSEFIPEGAKVRVIKTEKMMLQVERAPEEQ